MISHRILVNVRIKRRCSSATTFEEHSQSVELEAVTALSKGLNGIACYSDTNIINSRDANLQGKVPVGIPRNQAVLFLDYTLQTGPFAGFGAGGGVRYTGPTFASVSRRDPLHG